MLQKINGLGGSQQDRSAAHKTLSGGQFLTWNDYFIIHTT